MKRILTVIFLVGIFFSLAAEENKMEYETQYLPLLKKWEGRLSRAEAGIKEEETKITSLKSQISETENQTSAVWDEIYGLVGSDKAGIEQFRSELNDLSKSVRSFGALPNEEQYKQRAKLDEFQNQVNNLRTDKRSLLTEFMRNLDQTENNIKSIRSSIVVPYVTSYVVKKGDNLWKISGKEDIYNDPFKWTEIYKENKQTIKDWQNKYNAVLKEGQKEEDLIYPEQELTIPR